MLPNDWGASPVKIDNTVRGITAGLGKYGTDAVDWALVKAGIADIAPPPSKTVAEMPVVKAFLNSPYQASAYVERFYNAAKDAEQLVAAAKKAPEMMESKAQADWYKANADRLNHYGLGDGSPITQIRHVQSQLADIHKAQVTVQNDRAMSPDAKRDRLIELSRQRDTLAEQAFKGLFAPVDQVKYR
jgi:hypothetical protein